jgi:hypothetical protein
MKKIPKIHYDYLQYLFNNRSEQSLEVFEDEIRKRYIFDPLLKVIVDEYFNSLPSNCFHFICDNLDCSTEVTATIKISHAITLSNLYFNHLLLDSEINDHIQFSYDLRQIYDASEISFEIVDRAYDYKRELISFEKYISKFTEIRGQIEPI